MNICSKCHIDKPDDQYEKYWHSTQGKIRTRRICKGCINIQRKQYREMVKLKKIVQPEVPESIVDPNMDRPGYKECPDCKIWKEHRTHFFTSTGRCKYPICHDCRGLKNEKIRTEEMMMKLGGERILLKPNTYTNDVQRQTLFTLMGYFGWKFNDGIWYKDGIKDKNGNWAKLKTHGRI